MTQTGARRVLLALVAVAFFLALDRTVRAVLHDETISAITALVACLMLISLLRLGTS
ncbi:hypothetical protein [Sphingomonas sp. R1]|uniref:hypothetical protein n=1 Tax=Sphingomonas sp. R1 TaxID=399176 RepID=UPI002225ADD1|nr:hypothetical protein [Sphingomonas sp. R1]UYY78518.1 hypothetical protein OIM94_05825 [Sphingomonas sp. R1]